MNCPNCGGRLKHTVSEGQGANSTASRKVGGRNMSVGRTCVDCNRTYDSKDLIGHEE